MKGLLAIATLVGVPFTAAVFLLASPAVKTGDEDPARPSSTSYIDITELPQGSGLPVQVRTGLSFVEIEAVDESEGVFDATVDLRLRWKDLRLVYDPKLAPAGFVEFREEKATKKLEELWAPPVEFSNMDGEAAFQTQSLRLYPDGKAELLKRTKGRFKTSFDPRDFPFDHQKLTVEISVRGESLDRVTLDFRQDDLDYSGVSSRIDVPGWKLGFIDLKRSPTAGFYGESQARILASLDIARIVGPGLGTIFIPLIASLLIPLMAIYMNKVDKGEFQVEAFELSNIVIGGLFAVIALNFTVNADYPILGSGDNTVSRLFALNYLVLGGALAVIVVLFRFNLAQRAFGKYVQEQVYLFIIWGGPLLVLITATAIVLLAAA